MMGKIGKGISNSNRKIEVKRSAESTAMRMEFVKTNLRRIFLSSKAIKPLNFADNIEHRHVHSDNDTAH